MCLCACFSESDCHWLQIQQTEGWRADSNTIVIYSWFGSRLSLLSFVLRQQCCLVLLPSTIHNVLLEKR